MDFLRDPPEATGDEPENVVFEAPEIYEPVEKLEALAKRLTHFQVCYLLCEFGEVTHKSAHFFHNSRLCTTKQHVEQSWI